MQLYRFFSPDLSMKISNFSKTVHLISIKFCTVIILQIAPACAMASKSHDWDVRNMVKIIPKMIKNSHFWTFSIFSNIPYGLKELLWSHFKPYKGLIWAFHRNRMTGIRASHKEKDLRRHLYRTCGCGFSNLYSSHVSF